MEVIRCDAPMSARRVRHSKAFSTKLGSLSAAMLAGTAGWISHQWASNSVEYTERENIDHIPVSASRERLIKAALRVRGFELRTAMIPGMAGRIRLRNSASSRY